jgi:hypothetical protein
MAGHHRTGSRPMLSEHPARRAAHRPPSAGCSRRHPRPGWRLVGARCGPAPEWPWRCPLGRYSTPNSNRGGWLAGLTPAPGGLATLSALGLPSGLSLRVAGGRVLARNRPGAMSALQPLSGGKRTHCGHVATAVFDPIRTFGDPFIRSPRRRATGIREGLSAPVLLPSSNSRVAQTLSVAPLASPPAWPP